jgi:hypothetical protein
MWMKRGRFESEPARLFGPSNSPGLLHAKNMVEASVLRSDRGRRIVDGGSLRPGGRDLGRQKSENTCCTLAFEYADRGLIFRCGGKARINR